MTEKEIETAKKVLDDRRKALGKFYADEIVKKCEEEILKTGHANLDILFPDADIEEKHIAISKINSKGINMLDKAPYNGQWVIRGNPNYQLSKSVKKTNDIQKITLWITVGVSFLILLSAVANIVISDKNSKAAIKAKEAPPSLLQPNIRIDSVIVR